ncbi:hypothetical protein PF003_g20440 [Phytophthora fragariae]|nr:hypothetical protein PF003_g20440 [Phytophthora fragariae]
MRMHALRSARKIAAFCLLLCAKVAGYTNCRSNRQACAPPRCCNCCLLSPGQ